MTDTDNFLRGPVAAAGPTEPAPKAAAADDGNYLGSSRSFRLTADVTALMLKGAGYAALWCAGLLLVAWALLALSAALPEASKQAADPTPELSMALPPADAPLA